MFSLITPEMINPEVFREGKPVLLAFLRKGNDFAEHTKTLKHLSELYEDRLKVCLGDELFLDTFFKWFGFRGTPFYLLVSDGKVIGRFLGRADVGDLEKLLSDCGIGVEETS